MSQQQTEKFTSDEQRVVDKVRELDDGVYGVGVGVLERACLPMTANAFQRAFASLMARTVLDDGGSSYMGNPEEPRVWIDE